MEKQPGNSPSRRRRRAFRILSVLLGLLLAFAFCEILVRALDLPPKPLEPLTLHHFQLSENRLLKFEYQPNATPEEMVGLGDHRGFRINSAGFRDVEHTIAKPDGVTRIAVLGDSITVGVGIPDLEPIYPRQLQRILDSRPREDRVEVLNLGIAGYQTLQEVELLRVRGLAYDPDIVVIGFCVNDFSWNSDGLVVHQLKRQLDDNQQSVLLRTWRNSRWMNFLLARSRLLFCLHHRTRSLSPFIDLEWQRETRSGLVGTPFALGLQLLEQLQREHRFESWVFLIPAFDRPFSDYGHLETHQRARSVADERPSVKLVDLLDDFRRTGIEAADLTFDGLHPNDRGHELLARLIARHLDRP